MSLTPQQRDIVQTIGRPLLVLAGPGTGKTEVLAQRILFLIENNLATEGLSPISPAKSKSLGIKHLQPLFLYIM